ncbi:helix-turn-helix domain-containing protein [Pontibaca methylaminivorans]|uniref:Protein RodZ, contains Xre-like HTH and DUF4115 domains n=1 Tax=Pontibaca methylaminivorans TaxID=515897 RepID=A0A1R3X2V3_9RHOB|nr:RodZ domain-containing protein [Pontibaca methylaminivorans]SIT84967.1 protein RodZ, contains Xre-like HTH and DUF4115 domains [Pontibaca methylaminivorans]
MIGRKTVRNPEIDDLNDADGIRPRGFDDFDLRLGDVMRGERATLGKSLLDVQRDLRIKASYIAAIENSDPTIFETPGFIAGYVRSYARYLGMDPDRAFADFCRESGFSVAHGMSAEASAFRAAPLEAARSAGGGVSGGFSAPPFAPVSDGLFGGIDLRAIGSALVLVALIGGIGYGGWSVLKQVQQVRLAPVDQAPVVLADLDPLRDDESDEERRAPSMEALGRLYRPQALDTPVLVARDGPISSLDPREGGTFDLPRLPDTLLAQPASDGFAEQIRSALSSAMPQVVESPAPPLRMIAVRPAWVRIKAGDGSVLFEGIMENGQTYDVPTTEEPPTLRTGESGSVYFAVDGVHYGPVGKRGVVTSNITLSAEAIRDRYEVADLDRDRDLARMVAEAQTAPAATEPALAAP